MQPHCLGGFSGPHRYYAQPLEKLKTILRQFQNRELDVYDGAVIRDLGRLRWKIENSSFGEIT
jgi:hypothetical protein